MTGRPESVSVLVVDDSEEFLAVVGAWIESRSSLSLVGTARNGAEAQELVARLAPELVIIDSFMPVMDGFAATRAIKTRPGPPWVVMVSVHEGTTIEQEAWAAGADAFVAKASLASRMPSVIEGLRDGRPAPSRAAEPTKVPVRRPDDAPMEQRAIDAILRELGVAPYRIKPPARTGR